MYQLLVKTLSEAGKNVPSNKSPAQGDDHDLALRFLDCAVLNMAMGELDRLAAPMARAHFYQTVRGVFIEGKPIYEGARIYSKTHVQIAVRDLACVPGYFKPTG